MDLEKIMLFANLDENELNEIKKYIKFKTYEDGDLIFSEGDEGHSLFFILNGVVEIKKIIDTANKTRLARLEEGNIVGELAVLDNRPRSASAIAYLKSELGYILKEDIDKILESEPQLAYKLLKNILTIVIKRLRNADDELRNLSKRLYYY